MPDINRESRVEKNDADLPCLVKARTQLKQLLPYLPQMALFYMLLDFDAKDGRLIGWITDPNERGSIHIRVAVKNAFAGNCV